MLRRVAITVGSLLAIIIGIPALIVLVFVLFFDWNDARPLISRMISGVLGREFRIDGDLDVDVGWVTRLRAAGISLANASWGAGPKMLQIGALDVSVAIKPLFSGDIIIPSLNLRDTKAMLERNNKGVGNWVFGDPAVAKPESSSDDTRLPIIEQAKLDDAVLVYRDRMRDKEIKLRLDRLRAGENANAQRITVEGQGQYQGRPLRLDATMGSVVLLRDGGAPYPVDINAEAGDLGAKIAGTITDPQRLKGMNLKVDVRGEDMSNLFPLIGIPIPPTPPYRLQGKLTFAKTRWVFEDFAGVLGSSDMRGTVAVETGGKRMRLEGNVTSKRMDLKDFAGFIGASEGGRNPVTEATDNDGRILPDKPVDLTQLRAIDADIKFKGTKIVTPDLPIDRLDAAMTLDNGTLRVQPVSFAIGKGSVKVFFSLYGGETPVRSDIEAVVQQVDIQRFLKGSPMLEQTAGIFNGRVKISSTGTSVASILGSADGETMLVMSDGRVSHLLVELIGLDVAEAIGVLIEGDNSIPVRCIVADFSARQGVFDTRTLLFDTTDTKVVGSGAINMRDETLNLRLRPYPKDFSPLTLRTPITVQGTLAKPTAFPDPADIGVETPVKKVLNAVLTLVTGLLPPIDIGQGEDAPCADLINEARQRVGTQPSPKRR